jgi:hypothetical protein
VKKLIAFLIMAYLVAGCSGSHEHNQKLAEKEQLGNEISEGFHDYDLVRNQWILFNCTQKLAELRDIKLSAAFYRQQQELADSKNVIHAKLHTAIELAKKLYGAEVVGQADEITQAHKALNIFDNASNVTQDYCNRYQEIMNAHIEDNLAHYRETPG